MSREIGNRRSGLAGLFILSSMLCTTYVQAATAIPSLQTPVMKYESGITLLAAIRESLMQNPDIQLQQKQVDISRGTLLSATGQFDHQLTASMSRSRNNAPLGQAYVAYKAFTSETTTDTTDYNLNLSKEYHNGVTMSTGVDVTSTQSNVNKLLYGYQPEAISTVGLTIDFPMLKGSGVESVGANEKAADLNYEASNATLHHQVASTILQVVTDYWDYRAASENLKALTAAEKTAHKFIMDLQKLIDADQRPGSDIILAKADYASKLASKISAEQSLLQAKQKLALDIGLQGENIDNLGNPVDAFPPVSDRATQLSGSNVLVDDAMSRRWDLKAARNQLQANHSLLVASRLNNRNALDLKVGLGYSGLHDGNNDFSSLTDNRTSLNWSATLTYKWDIGNNVSNGAYVQQSAVYDQNLISTRNLMQKIRAGVMSAALSVRRTGLQERQSQAALDLYELSIRDEIKKLKLGSATILDVVTLQNQLLTAKLNYISQNAQYAIAIATLRYATGYLISGNDGSGNLTQSDFSDIPVFDHQNKP